VTSERRPIAEIGFVDGTVRPVFEDLDGRQYVEDNGERVYGMWVFVDEPLEAYDRVAG
jgi:hypothetical protein